MHILIETFGKHLKTPWNVCFVCGGDEICQWNLMCADQVCDTTVEQKVFIRKVI